MTEREQSCAQMTPRCGHVPLCGGCAWQQRSYAAQLQEKEKKVKEIFAPLPGGDCVEEIIPCDDPWQYRNKMEFSFSQNRAGERFLGLMLAGSKGRVLNLVECHLVSPWFITLLNGVRTWWAESGLDAWRLNDTGTLRTLVVREGKRTGDRLVMLTVSGNPAFAPQESHLRGFVEAVRASLPATGARQSAAIEIGSSINSIQPLSPDNSILGAFTRLRSGFLNHFRDIPEEGRLSIFLRVQQALKGSPTQFFEMHLHGPDHLLEKMHLPGREEALVFKISPTSFFQTNTLQAEKLYAAALNMVSFPKRHVLDLYAGTATLGVAIAARANKVTAIEISPQACLDAESNRELNGMDNLEILCGDVGKKLEELAKRPDFVSPDLVIVDPPRAGLDAAALGHLKSLLPQEILYISCNPVTQAANIQELLASGYRLVKVQPVDQFPHTPHIENIASLQFG